MPETPQKIAAAVSARNRLTARLLSDLRKARPLLAEQRESIIAAASAIPTVDGTPGSAA
jgi:hypothetical protein